MECEGNMSRILITGGAGFIGSHTTLTLLGAGYDVIIVDNLSNSSHKAVDAIGALALRETGKQFTFYEGDVADGAFLRTVFEKNKIDAVIHFAGFKAVGESVAKPAKYYVNNLLTTLTLLNTMKEFGVTGFVFSSSATVYSDPGITQYDESTTRVGRASSPYGTTKVIQEWILEDIAKSGDLLLKVISLRYFNPVGAHSSGEIGESPQGIPNNLTPFITQVAVGKRDFLSVFGDDYPTPDGTCIRDYIHVTDLAEAHYLAVKRLLETNDLPEFDGINIGSGKGYSVFEVIAAFDKAVGKKIPYKVVSRRDGDLAEFTAKTEKAQKLLGFTTKLTIGDMAKDAWNWQSKHPNGFDE
ncbi:UDP-glucose 4-epimerase [Betaproteobacteria bacterium]|nr:UDP-glucose 4-epimerase [Betaproteobacteria bacterium]